MVDFHPLTTKTLGVAVNDRELIEDDDCSYIFSTNDYPVIAATKELLWKTARCELPTARQLEVIARALQVFESLPVVMPDFDIQIQITGPRRTFGEHEIYHWWHVEIEQGDIKVSAGGHFYRPTTGGDTFSSMAWQACPGYAAEHHNYLDSLTIVDDALPFELEVQAINFSLQDYLLDVCEDGEEIDAACRDNENDDAENNDLPEDESSDQISLDEVVRKLESIGVECVWVDQTSLYSVDLQECSISDSSFSLLGKIPALRTLDARNTDISDRTIIFIKHLKSLEWLCLRNTSVTDEGLRHLQMLQGLQHLDLIGTLISGPGLTYLRNLSNLRELYVSGFQYHDKWLEMLRHELAQCTIYLN